MSETERKLEISYHAANYTLQRAAQTGKDRKRSGRPWCKTLQEDKYLIVCTLRRRHKTEMGKTTLKTGKRRCGWISLSKRSIDQTEEHLCDVE